MLVSQIMQRDVLTMQPTESIQEAAKRMRERHVGVVIVLEEDKFQGILTERELTMAIAANSDSAGSAPSDDVAKREPAVNADRNRCNYFSDVQVERLLGG